MEKFGELGEKIKVLKKARDILQNEYTQSEFHQKKEANPQDIVPPSPEDEEIYKLLTAIQQLDIYVKKLQDEQYQILKENE
jgi:hypothetical protein